MHEGGPKNTRPIGRTSIGTPLLSLPHPYGYSASVMQIVLKRVVQYVQGGSHISPADLASSVDPDHLHGAMIGHFAKTLKPQWEPLPFDFSAQTTEMKAQAHRNTCFNKVMSNSLPLDRPIPDVRPTKCHLQWFYNVSTSTESQRTAPSFMTSMFRSSRPSTEAQKPLPKASVIIIYYNEPLSTLLRSIHSVLNRSPPELLHEIILVDDGSDKNAPWLLEGGELEHHMQLLPKTYLGRLTGRNGLMFARNAGAALATGEALIFLDSHIETMVGWLEPLVGRIAEGERTGANHVVVPAIDNIDADSFKFNKGGIDILGHSWGLGQVGLPNSMGPNRVEGMKSPIMAGGLLALSRAYFDKLGFYDPGMKIWGGEEMEISFRIWLCGGTLECLPCSRVGHVFRSSKFWQGQVYKVPGEVIARNRLRASFWMDGYAELSRLSAAPLAENETIGSMQFYHDVKKRLDCKPFRWYLEHVNPTLWDSANRLFGVGHKAGLKSVMDSFQAHGYLLNPSTNLCLDHLHYRSEGVPYGVYPCHFTKGSQSVVFTNGGMIIAGERLLEGCLTRVADGLLKQNKCTDDLKDAQIWVAVERPGGLVAMKGEGKCLTTVKEEEQDKKSAFSLRMKPCGGRLAEKQDWKWENTQKHFKTVKETEIVSERVDVGKDVDKDVGKGVSKDTFNKDGGDDGGIKDDKDAADADADMDEDGKADDEDEKADDDDEKAGDEKADDDDEKAGDEKADDGKADDEKADEDKANYDKRVIADENTANADKGVIAIEETANDDEGVIADDDDDDDDDNDTVGATNGDDKVAAKVAAKVAGHVIDSSKKDINNSRGVGVDDGDKGGADYDGDDDER